MLEGTGGTQIKGLITYSGISTHTASTTGANGDTFTPADVASWRSKLPDAVDAPTAWVMRQGDVRGADEPPGRRRQRRPTARGRSCSADRRSRRGALPGELYGTRVVRSAQVSNTRVKGGGTNLTYILLGYFPDWVVARMGVMEFLASAASATRPCRTTDRTCAASSTSTPARATRRASCCATSSWSRD